MSYTTPCYWLNVLYHTMLLTLNVLHHTILLTLNVLHHTMLLTLNVLHHTMLLTLNVLHHTMLLTLNVLHHTMLLTLNVLHHTMLLTLNVPHHTIPHKLCRCKLKDMHTDPPTPTYFCQYSKQPVPVFSDFWPDVLVGFFFLGCTIKQSKQKSVKGQFFKPFIL